MYGSPMEVIACWKPQYGLSEKPVTRELFGNEGATSSLIGSAQSRAWLNKAVQSSRSFDRLHCGEHSPHCLAPIPSCSGRRCPSRPQRDWDKGFSPTQLPVSNPFEGMSTKAWDDPRICLILRRRLAQSASKRADLAMHSGAPSIWSLSKQTR